MEKRQLISIAAGLGAAALFILPFVIGAGLLFLFLPLLPLFMIGFGMGTKLFLLAAIAATLTVMTLASSGAGVFFLIFLMVPALLLIRQSLLWRTNPTPPVAGSAPEREWYPLGFAVTELVLYIAGVFLLAALYYALRTGGGLEAVFAESLAESFREMEPEYRHVMEQLVARRIYAVFASGAWIWVLVICTMAYLAHRILREWRRNIRPSFSLLPFDLPFWLLGLLTLAGVASLVGSPQSLFIGKTLLLLLLLPFFLHGMALLHEVSRPWPARALILLMVYFLLLAQLWPALLIACAGVIQQCRLFAQRLTAG